MAWISDLALQFYWCYAYFILLSFSSHALVTSGVFLIIRHISGLVTFLHKHVNEVLTALP